VFENPEYSGEYSLFALRVPTVDSSMDKLWQEDHVEACDWPRVGLQPLTAAGRHT
jgi:hypothetical protein